MLGFLVFRDFGIFRFWDFEFLAFWDFEILRFWDFGILDEEPGSGAPRNPGGPHPSRKPGRGHPVTTHPALFSIQ